MNINNINFSELYKEQKALSPSSRVTTSATWDKKAAYMDKRVKHSIYNDAFISKMNLDDCDTLLDFGCGTGNISLSIANNFSSIHAIDYSKVMIETYQNNAKEIAVNNTSTYVKSLNEDWLDIPTCDIVVASRSIFGMQDIQSALTKLNEYANKRVYLTYKTNFGFFDKRLYDALGRTKTPSPDYIYLINILYSMDIYATVDFIPAESKYQSHSTLEIFTQNVIWELGELSEDELQKVESYFNEYVKAKEDKPAHWALISWDKTLV